MDVLEHESDQLINNLGLEQIVGIPEIANFRGELAEKIGKLQITEQEREMMRRVNSIQRDNLKWKALSGALNNTMMITGGGNNAYQIGFQVLVTAARTGIEYKTAQNEQTIEELRAMWDLRKKDLNDFIELRKSALNILFKLYQKYNLKESDRLTEQTSMLFNKIISNPDPKTMVRQLGDHQEKFAHIADYYYYLGMGNLDCGNVKKAEECFDRYTTLYNKAPLFRINEKAGMIALARLGYNSNMSKDEVDKNISTVLSNLPNNAMAIIQCALMSDNVLNNPTKALSILRKALDNESTDDKTAIILTASLLLPRIKSTSQVYQDFIAAYLNQPHYDLDAAINIWIARKENIFSKLSRIFTVEDLASSHWIADYDLNDRIKFYFPSKYTVNLDRVKMFVEHHENDQVTIKPYNLSEKYTLSIEKIEKVADFKNNPDLKYLFMDALDPSHFVVKRNLDYTAISNLTFPRIAELSISDIKKVVKFLKENAPENTKNEIIAIKSENDIVEKIKNAANKYILKNNIYGEIYHVLTQADNTYVKFLLDDPRKIEICYKFDAKNGKLLPAYIKSQGKFTFANNAMMKEFGFSSSPKKATTNTQKKEASVKQTKKESKKKEKSWWNFWSAEDSDDSKQTPSKTTNKSIPAKKNTTKDSKETSKDDKPWWKIWGDDTKSKEQKSTKQTTKSSTSKKDEKKEEAKEEKSWWHVW